jgi:ribosomal protein S18 acetylase RimI-like enzyme
MPAYRKVRQIGPQLHFAEAMEEDAGLLTETAIQSKKSWGYPEEWMKIWEPELMLTPQYILDHEVVKVYEAQTFLGFFALIRSESGAWEIDHLWLKHEHMRKGHGVKMMDFIFDFIRKTGVESCTVIAEPNARGFYEKAGGKVIGQHEGKIKGRILDIYEFRF